MLLHDLVLRLSELLNIEDYAGVDNSLNGLQVSRKRQEVDRVAFAVDASLASFKRAADAEADLLFVHHGLFWERPTAVTGGLYRRLRFLIENDLALFAAHLPLDCHPELGNNIRLAGRLGLRETRPFGDYRGIQIGFRGVLEEAMPLEEIEKRICGSPEAALGVLPFGPTSIRSVGIVSGGLPRAAAEAIREGLDLFITGESSHEIYHECLEAGINVLFGGHYQTETWGVLAVRELLQRWGGLETTLIDVPTGL